MTDLTEKWKKGEFIICNAGKCQYYYVRNEEQQEVIKTEYCLFDDNTPNWQILAPVPSYEEWKALKASYEMLNDANLKQATWMADMEKYNAKLEELLRECRPALVRFVAYDDSEENARILLMNKINEALK